MKRILLLILLTPFLAFNGYTQNSITTTKKHPSMKTKKILFVVTSFDKIESSGKKTGIWIEEFATPYYLLTAQGAQISIASPRGGKAPIDPKSALPDFSTASVKKFYADPIAQERLNQTVKIDQVKAEDYDAIFYPGGHGPMWDLPENSFSIHLIESFYQQNKPVALVCHAPAALKNVKDKNGNPLVKGKKISGFTNSEEVAGQSTDQTPFSLEDMLVEKGANYVKGKDWQPYAVQDGVLITGQNPASAELVAEKIINALKQN